MPNHVYNILEISENCKKIKAFCKSKESEMDFNNIIAMPEELIGTQSPQSKKEEETEEEFKTRINNLTEKYGTSDWYTWSIKNWGTKWNAYNVITDNEDCIIFDTAWSSPYEIVEQLSIIFPNTEFTMKYADEDLGQNCGTYIYKNGELISDIDGDLEFACELQGIECSVCEKCGRNFANWEEVDKCYECQEEDNK